jgi:hypothetical protein
MKARGEVKVASSLHQFYTLTTVSSLRNQIKSSFLRLPAELPNNIYKYVLGGRR